MSARRTAQRGRGARTRRFALAVSMALLCTARATAQDTGALDLQTWRLALARSLQDGPSPRDWALGSQLLETRPATGSALPERAAILQRAARAAPGDLLVQALWSNLPAPDPPCPARTACIAHAAAWADADPQNGAAWLAVVGQAWQDGEARVADTALARMAATDRYNEHLGVAVAAWQDLLRRHPSPLPKHVPRAGSPEGAAPADEDDLVLEEALATATMPLAALFHACAPGDPDAGAARASDCAQVARLLMRHAQTLAGRTAGVALLRRLHAGTPADVAMVRTVTWQDERYRALAPAIGGSGVARRNHLRLLQATDSEIEVVQYELRIAGVPLTPPEDWRQTVNGRPVEPLEDPADAGP